MKRPHRYALAALLAALTLLAGVLAASADTGTPTPRTVTGTASCTTTNAGKCTINHTLGAVPTSVLLTPIVPDGQTLYMLVAVDGGLTATTFTVKARTASGTNASNRAIKFSYQLYAEVAAPPTSSVTSPTTATSTSASPIPTSTSTSSPAPTTTSTTPAPSGLNLPRIASPMPDYYNAFPGAKAWANTAFFPIGVWYEAVTQQSDIDKDKAAGLNTYVMLTGNSSLSLIRQNGMWAMPEPSGPAGAGSETVGWMLADEVELWGHEGSAAWTGNYPGQGPICNPESALCGYTILKTEDSRTPQNDGRLRYQNLGFGVDTYIGDAPSAKFLDYTQASSIDRYWYTDTGICTNAGSNIPAAQCHKAASYGASVDRMRALAKQSAANTGKPVQPTYGFVEDGCPFTQFTTCITGPQIQAAVMSELIHEARGIIYFNHNFSGNCQSQHVLRESCGDAVRPYVTAMNQHIKDLAPVLNTLSYEWTFNPDLDTMLKQGPDGSFYIFAAPGRGKALGSKTLTFPAGLSAAKADVLYEGRSVTVTNGQLTDTYGSDTTWHIYKLVP